LGLAGEWDEKARPPSSKSVIRGKEIRKIETSKGKIGRSLPSPREEYGKSRTQLWSENFLSMEAREKRGEASEKEGGPNMNCVLKKMWPPPEGGVTQGGPSCRKLKSKNTSGLRCRCWERRMSHAQRRIRKG